MENKNSVQFHRGPRRAIPMSPEELAIRKKFLQETVLSERYPNIFKALYDAEQKEKEMMSTPFVSPHRKEILKPRDYVDNINKAIVIADEQRKSEMSAASRPTTEYFDVSVDIETLSTAKNAVVTSIALVAFNEAGVASEDGIIVYLRPEQQLKKGRDISIDTLYFWAGEDGDLFRQQLKPEKALATRVAFSRLKNWISKNNIGAKPVRLWCKGPAFDGAIIEDLISSVVAGREVLLSAPYFHYRNWRDVRSVVDVANSILEANTGETLNSFPPAKAHNALSDAIAQAEDVRQAYRVINSYAKAPDHDDRPVFQRHLSARETVQGLTDLSNYLHQKNVEAGWWNDPKTGEDLRNNDYAIMTKTGLIFTELSEAIEGFRTDAMDDKLPAYRAWDAEMADVFIRFMDLVGLTVEDIGKVVDEKLRYNNVRADHKVENRVKKGGKKF